MNLVTDHTLRRWLIKEAMRRRATVVPYSPQEIYIDPCNMCDLRCTFCPQSNWGKRSRGMMSYDVFTQLIDEAVQLNPRRLNLFCFGEPLLHKRIFDMLRDCSKRGLHVRLHTNARSLNESNARKLLEAGLSELCFSFDTADKELYNRMRVGSDFDLVLRNIRRFLQIKRDGGYKSPQVRVQEMVPFTNGQDPSNSQTYRRLFNGYDVTFKARHMHNFAGGSAEREFPGIKLQGESQCRQIYSRIVVTFDGKVHACCLDAEGYNIVGDVTKGDTIASAWNNPAMQRIRRLTNEHKLDNLRPCDTCDILHRGRRPPAPLHKRIVGSVLWWLYGPLTR